MFLCNIYNLMIKCNKMVCKLWFTQGDFINLENSLFSRLFTKEEVGIVIA